MASNTRGRRDPSVRWTWSWQLNYDLLGCSSSWDIPRRDGHQVKLWPHHDDLWQITQHLWHGVPLLLQIRHHGSVVTHENNRLSCLAVPGRHSRPAEPLSSPTHWQKRSLSSWDQMPSTIRSRRCAHQPVNDASVYRRKEGDTWNGTPDVHFSSWSHQTMHSLQPGDGRASTARWSDAGNQWVFSCHWRGHIWAQLLEMNRSREAMWPRRCYHIFAGSDGRRRNLSARSRNLTIRESIGKTLSWMVSISIQRYQS